MVWILITTFMVVVGTGHCCDASALSTDLGESFECQQLKATPQPSHVASEKVSQCTQLPTDGLTAPELSLYRTFATHGIGSSRAMGSSTLADMRFSGTSPPVSLVR